FSSYMPIYGTVHTPRFIGQIGNASEIQPLASTIQRPLSDTQHGTANGRWCRPGKRGNNLLSSANLVSSAQNGQRVSVYGGHFVNKQPQWPTKHGKTQDRAHEVRSDPYTENYSRERPFLHGLELAPSS
ncbi:hypothetical protein, partial [Bifidobacterium animalis]|uniref:hypothetical protein n=1 Tax=Bifidobacterium animalis TaxID=28025 RepID=UPI0019D3C2BF